ncbi:MAG: peptide chain release factor N(5)-glutamine methyltransferase [Flavobacteriaceae bacterium]
MLLREIKNIFHQELEASYPKEEVGSFFYMLIEHYLDLERFVLVLQPELVLSKEQEQPLFEALAQLKLGRPIQYITGTSTFMELPLLVNEHVLIPRPETEELVQWIIDDVTQLFDPERQKLKILDIGTGSGCIAIALAKNLPNSHVFAIEISKEALKVAKTNADKNQVMIDFFEADILTTDQLDGTFDIIVSNPPYVLEREKEQMHKNVKAYEPKEALFVADETPLLFYEKIADLAADHLNTPGTLYFEINQYLGPETKVLLKERNFLEIEMRKDIFKNNRFLKAIKGPKVRASSEIDSM